MKWYKHVSDSLDDPFIFELMDEFGADGYLVFFGTLEIYSREFSLKDDWKLSITWSYLHQKLRISRTKLQKILSKIYKWEVSFTNTHLIIFIPKFKELIDNWTLRQIPKTTEQLQSKDTVTTKPIRIKKKNKEEDKSMADAAFILPSKEEIQEASDPLIEENIKKVSKALYDEKIFPEVHAFKNTMLKQKKNLRSILHTLTRVYLKKEFKDGPWAYGLEIIKLEDLNYNERDYQKTAQ